MLKAKSSMKQEKKQLIKKAFTATIPVMTGYLVLAIGFGILLKTKGYGLGWAVMMSVFIYAGSILGDIIPFNVEGIDFALTALFVTIYVEQWLSCKNHKPALIGAGCSVLSLILFGADHFLIPAMAMIVAFLVGVQNEIGKQK